jgi:hypothetical protein
MGGDNKIAFDAPNSYKWKMKLNTKNGSLKGSVGAGYFSHGVTLKMSGVVLQESDVGRGFFLGEDTSGSLKLE